MSRPHEPSGPRKPGPLRDVDQVDRPRINTSGSTTSSEAMPGAAYFAEARAFAQRLISAGIPVVVCRPNPTYSAGGRERELLTPVGWNVVTARECSLDAFRPGIDVLAMVAGHGVDVVDVDTKSGGDVRRLPPFRRFGRHRTPSGGHHDFVVSTGIGQISPLDVGGGHVGDYCGGTVEGGSRRLVFLPGSTRPKYPNARYEVEEPLDLDALLDSAPDDDLVAALLESGGSSTGAAGSAAGSSADVDRFMVDHRGPPTPLCNYGRSTLARLLEESRSVVPGDALHGRHGWALRSVCRVVELIRAGCCSASDLEALQVRLAEIKPEGGTDFPALVAWALTNATGASSCYLHQPGEAGTSRQRDPHSRKVRSEDSTDDRLVGAARAGRGGADRDSGATQLVLLARSRFELGVTPGGEPFAVPVQGPRLVRLMRGGGNSLRGVLASEYYALTGKVVSQQALTDALGVLEGQAAQGSVQDLHLRVADHGGRTYLDLGDLTGRAVCIDTEGWSLVDRPPVLFRRTELTSALAEPQRGGSVEELWRLLNVSEPDRPLVLAWLVAALQPGISHPILALRGEQGTGKSTAMRLLAALIDPSPAQTRRPPRDVDTWVTAGSGSWIVPVDNVSAVPDWWSDALCRAVTGDGDVRRRLYTDAGLFVHAFRRVVILNGIDLGAVRDDLAERLLVVELSNIPEGKRRLDAQLDGTWREAHPRILGALLDLAVAVRRVTADLVPGRLPRMADFALVLTGVDAVLGTNGMSRYTGQASEFAADALDADPVLAAITGNIRTGWTGTAAHLLTLITPVTDSGRPPPNWPKNAGALTGLLRRRAPSLRRLGWTVTDLGRGGKANVIRFHLAPPLPPAGAGDEGGRQASSVAGQAVESTDACPSGPPPPAESATQGEEAGEAGADHANSPDLALEEKDAARGAGDAPRSAPAPPAQAVTPSAPARELPQPATPTAFTPHDPVGTPGPATDAQRELSKLAEPVWPRPGAIAAFAGVLLELGLPAPVADLVARATVFPEAATVRPVLDQQGVTAQYEIEADFRSCLILPFERWKSVGQGYWGQSAPSVPLGEGSLHPSLLPVTSYHVWTSLEEFAAAEQAVLGETASSNVGAGPRLEIRPGLLHLAQPYLAEQHHPRQQLLLLATDGGRSVAAGHRWADLSVGQVMHFCREPDYWDRWIEVAKVDWSHRLPDDHPFKHLRHDRVSKLADAMRRYERARTAGLVIPGRLTLKMVPEGHVANRE